MRIIEITQLENGAHKNYEIFSTNVPDGCAVIPDDLETPNFPFGTVEVEEVDGVMTVTAWTAGEIPEPEPPAEPEEPPDIPVPEPSADEIIDVLLGVTA